MDPQIPSPQYIYYESKLLAPVVYFADPVETSLLAVWAEQNEHYTWFLFALAGKRTTNVLFTLDKKS